MRMEFLGTGTSQGVPVVACACAVCCSADPRDQRLRSSVRITVGGAELLIDAGPDLRQQALRSGMQRLDAVLLTHEHMDHVSGIDELRAFNFVQQQAMVLHGLPRTLDAVRRIYHYAFVEHKYPGVPELRLDPVGTEVFHAAGVPVTPVEVMHDRLPVLGYRIGDVAYITDAKTIAAGERMKLKGLDVLVINALRIKPHHSHFNMEEALAVVAELAPRRAFFTHISHLLGRHVEVGLSLPDGVELACDGLVVHADGP
ncbi:MAG: MBL fold metallo-hydrolase [Flavobacteriales bacterium]|nr:MBL fold metallo-hydrolase [Flavobacteriales bacterium]